MMSKHITKIMIGIIVMCILSLSNSIAIIPESTMIVEQVVYSGQVKVMYREII